MAVSQKEIVARFAVLFFLIALVGTGVIGGIVRVQYLDGDRWAKEEKSLQAQEFAIPASRGDIYAADGRVLATSIPSYNVHIDLGADGVKKVFERDIDALADSLSQLFRNKAKWRYKSELTSAYKKGRRYYSLIDREVSYLEIKRMKKFPILRRGKYAGGFIIARDDQRFHPHRELAKRTIGALNKGEHSGTHGNIGITGIEGMCENYLRGKEGVSLKQNLSGHWIPITEVEPEDGYDVITTLDVYMQDAAESALLNQLKKSEALYGTAILMEVQTGEIKAIANLGKTKDGSYIENYNYAIGHQGCGEPGSTFKLVSLMVAMEQGLIDTADVYDTEKGVWKYSTATIRDSDWRKGGHGKMTVKEIFEKSSNVGVAKIITECYIGKEKEFINRIYSLGFNKKLNMGIKGEGVPDIKHPDDKKRWWGPSLALISYGYEISITPMHTLAFYNAIANDGAMMKPQFLKAVRHRGKVIKTFSSEVLNPSICSKETLGKAKDMLDGVVEHGTASNLKNPNYKIAGKTGTAQVANQNKGYYHEGRRVYQSSFVGYFPADDPRYTCLVVVMGPKGAYYGGSVAGPVFKEIADKAYTTNIEMHAKAEKLPELTAETPRAKSGATEELKKVCTELALKKSGEGLDNEWSYVGYDSNELIVKDLNMIDGLVPNVVGMGAADAVYLLEQSGLKIQLKGLGKVEKQSPLPGNKIKKGQTVYIDLS